MLKPPACDESKRGKGKKRVYLWFQRDHMNQSLIRLVLGIETSQSYFERTSSNSALRWGEVVVKIKQSRFVQLRLLRLPQSGQSITSTNSYCYFQLDMENNLAGLKASCLKQAHFMHESPEITMTEKITIKGQGTPVIPLNSLTVIPKCQLISLLSF